MRMMISSWCNICQKEDESAGKEYFFDHNNRYLSNFTEDGIAQFTCERGHKTWTMIKQAKFEILYDLGAMALAEGFTREAVSSFSTALERYYEFAIELISISKGLDYEMHSDLWKGIPYSEQQLGAYIYAFYSELRVKPPLLSSNQKEFRNDVVHKGLIPTEEKSLNFGQGVLEIIQDSLILLHENFRNSNQPFIEIQRRHTRRVGEKMKNVICSGGLSGPSIIQLRSIGSKDFKKNKLIDSLKVLNRENRYKFGYHK